ATPRAGWQWRGPLRGTRPGGGHGRHHRDREPPGRWHDGDPDPARRTSRGRGRAPRPGDQGTGLVPPHRQCNSQGRALTVAETKPMLVFCEVIKLPWRRTKRSRGQALVEFAIILPVLALLLMLALDFGRVFFGWVALINAARIAANAAAVSPDAWSGGGNPGLQASYRQQVINDLNAINCRPGS